MFDNDSNKYVKWYDIRDAFIYANDKFRSDIKVSLNKVRLLLDLSNNTNN